MKSIFAVVLISIIASTTGLAASPSVSAKVGVAIVDCIRDREAFWPNGLQEEYAVMIDYDGSYPNPAPGSMLVTVYNRYPDEKDRPRHYHVPSATLKFATDYSKLIMNVNHPGTGGTARIETPLSYQPVRGTLSIREDAGAKEETFGITCRMTASD
jgi:hypothetical protein